MPINITFIILLLVAVSVVQLSLVITMPAVARRLMAQVLDTQVATGLPPLRDVLTEWMLKSTRMVLLDASWCIARAACAARINTRRSGSIALLTSRAATSTRNP